jgi:hypothetical protein
LVTAFYFLKSYSPFLEMGVSIFTSLFFLVGAGLLLSRELSKPGIHFRV